jgi:hypothetical protein
MHTQTTTVRLLALASVAISVTARVAFAQDDEEPPNVEASGDIVEGQGPEEPAPDLPPEAASTDSAGELAKDLANPIADLISLPFQLNYDEGFGPKDAGRFTLNIQPVIPFDISEDWNLITRTIVPVIHQESIADGVDSDFGLGDTLQSFFFSPKQPVNGWLLGAGPAVLWPTGTEPRLRSESLSLGPTAVALRQEQGWTYGVLANHLWSVTTSDSHGEVNRSFVQPFLAYTWPTATTLSLNCEATYDWTSEEWTVPITLTASQVMKIGDLPISVQIGPRYYAESAGGGPEWGVRLAVTFMFPK